MEAVPLPHIGIDESGKGDFFGPLVIAGALLDESSAKICLELGVCDSKKLNDKKILQLAVEIRKLCVHDIIAISPKKYNELYGSFKNLNKLLAWGHATVLENILSKKPCELAISDKFADENVILRALKERGKSIKLIQRTKAEEDIAVACASVLARAGFVNGTAKLSGQFELDFPKGASPKVVEAGQKFVQKYGEAELKNVAKLHFKTREQCI
ncbi:ribonuclease HIII [Candidatus Gastranaerophilus sp. (ex Termes propinquus)]|nr:ribonuclease HIII [Candidatus Gastranaerophilus sp. (ex Termes propinquus)]